MGYGYVGPKLDANRLRALPQYNNCTTCSGAKREPMYNKYNDDKNDSNSNTTSTTTSTSTSTTTTTTTSTTTTTTTTSNNNDNTLGLPQGVRAEVFIDKPSRKKVHMVNFSLG